MPNFVPIDHTFAEIWPIFDFKSWRPSAILDLFHVYLDHPWKASVFVTVQNVVGIKAVVSIICQF